MAYSEEFLGGAIVPQDNKPLTPLNLVGSTGDYAQWLVGARCKLTRVMVMIDVVIATSTANAVVSIYRRPNYGPSGSGSSSGQVLLATITVPTGTAIGKILYKNIESVSLKAGEVLCAKLTTQGTDGSSATGKGYVLFSAFPVFEDPANEANMIASA